jgi:hypothetical protein
MKLFYIHPHYRFDFEDIPEDFDLTGFVTAFDIEDAIQLWCGGVEDMIGAELQLDTIYPADPLNREAYKRTVLVRDLTFNLDGGQTKFIPWDDIDTVYVAIKEIPE